jgi:cytoskeletal protein CcmA (bactofilin family)
VQDSGTRTVSTIGEDLTITGNVASKGEIHLDGHVQGDVNCGALVLGENSSVEGNVTADDVVIGGRLIGSVRAFRLMLQSTSHVEGDLIHQSLAMEQGAFFEGKSRRSDNPLSANHATAEKRCQVNHNRQATISRSKRRRRKGRSCETCPNRSKFGSNVLCVGGKHV